MNACTACITCRIFRVSLSFYLFLVHFSICRYLSWVFLIRSLKMPRQECRFPITLETSDSAALKLTRKYKYLSGCFRVFLKIRNSIESKCSSISYCFCRRVIGRLLDFFLPLNSFLSSSSVISSSCNFLLFCKSSPSLPGCPSLWGGRCSQFWKYCCGILLSITSSSI